MRSVAVGAAAQPDPRPARVGIGGYRSRAAGGFPRLEQEPGAALGVVEPKTRREAQGGFGKPTASGHRAAPRLRRVKRDRIHLNFCRGIGVLHLVRGLEKKNSSWGWGGSQGWAERQESTGDPGGIKGGQAGAGRRRGTRLCCKQGPGKNPECRLRLCSRWQIAAKHFEVQIKVFHQVRS